MTGDLFDIWHALKPWEKLDYLRFVSTHIGYWRGFQKIDSNKKDYIQAEKRHIAFFNGLLDLEPDDGLNYLLRLVESEKVRTLFMDYLELRHTGE